ncbi:MAG: DUF1428 domain-containing protein [Boseongicola sp.]|nr:DUF1428 domain-containing protein [Boseongicola sp.]
MPFVNGFLLAVPEKNKERYRDLAETSWEVFRDNGCLSMRENWGVDVPDGKVTSFPMAVKAEPGEIVVFSWMEWPDKETADKGMRAAFEDPRMEAFKEMPFDGMRMMWGGFEPLVDRRV